MNAYKKLKQENIRPQSRNATKYLISLLLILFSSSVWCEDKTLAIEKKWGIPNVQSPNASDLGRYGDIPMSLYTGRANISIPLYTLTARGLELPISLDYDTSGLLMNSLPGWMGHNWTLNVGGVITRSIQGIRDEECENFYARGHGRFFTSLDVEQLLHGNITDNEQIGHDLAPDIFTFNVMGKSGRFFIDTDKQWKVYSDDNIEVLFDVTDESNYMAPLFEFYPGSHSKKMPKIIKGFCLRDEQGTIYEFGGVHNAIEYSIPFEAQDCLMEGYSSPWGANSWFLTKVMDKYGNILYTFEYERGAFIAQMYHWYEISDASWEYKSSSALSSVKASGYLSEAPYVVHTHQFPFSGELISPVYLHKIKNADQVALCFHSSYIPFSTDSMYLDNDFKARFTTKLNGYEQRANNLRIADNKYSWNTDDYDDNTLRNLAYQNGEYPYYYLQATDTITKYQYRQGLSRYERFQNPLAQSRIRQLDSICVCNGQGDTQIAYSFHYDFRERMHLISFSSKKAEGENVWSYAFLYNNYNKVPQDYLTRRIDHWGYLKKNAFFYPIASSSQNETGDGYIHDENEDDQAPRDGLIEPVTDIDFGDVFGEPTTSSWVDYFSKQRESDNSQSKYGMLTEIIYPTGGRSVIEYENNDYRYYMSEDRQEVIDSIKKVLDWWEENKDIPDIFIDPTNPRNVSNLYPQKPSTTLLCGGLRVKSISEYEGENLRKTKRFEYHEPSDTLSSGVLFARPRYSWSWSFRNYQNVNFYLYSFINNSILPLSNYFGPHVGYTYVNVIEETGNTLYKYQNIDTYKDLPADTIFRTSRYSPYDRFSERGYGRGRLTAITQYDAQKNKVQHSSIFYNEQGNEDKYVFTSNANFGWISIDQNIADKRSQFAIGSFYRLFYPKYTIATQTDSVKNGNRWDVITKRYKYDKVYRQIATPYQHYADACKVRTELIENIGRSMSTEYLYGYNMEGLAQSLFQRYYDLSPVHIGHKKNNIVSSVEGSEYRMHEHEIVLDAVWQKNNNQQTDTLIVFDDYTNTYALKQFTKKGELPTRIYWNNATTRIMAMVQGTITSLNNIGNTQQWDLTRIQSPRLKITSFTYDTLGNVSSITSPTGNTEHYQYDLAGRLHGVTNHFNQQLRGYLYQYSSSINKNP